MMDTVTETLVELARHKNLVRILRDPANWKDGRWAPYLGAYSPDLFNTIDQLLKGEKVSEDQQRLPS